MIELSFMEYCMAIVIGSLLLVALFGWISRFAYFNDERRGRRARFVCDLCLTTWEDRGKEKLVECPHCGRSCRRAR
ncbi:MAG: hypothetical protein ACOVRB_12205 [Akkermansiaceae bacterium]|jgi:hypothetical protein